MSPDALCPSNRPFVVDACPARCAPCPNDPLSSSPSVAEPPTAADYWDRVTESRPRPTFCITARRAAWLRRLGSAAGARRARPTGARLQTPEISGPAFGRRRPGKTLAAHLSRIFARAASGTGIR